MDQLPLFEASQTVPPSEPDRPFKLQIYDLSDPSLLDAAIKRLEETPADQWPSLEFRHNMLISVKLRQMELAEIECSAALSAPSTDAKVRG